MRMAPRPSIRDKSCGSTRGQTLDLSSSGAFVRTDQPLRLYTQVQVELDLSTGDSRGKFTLPACVVRTNTAGAGLEWCEPLPFEVRCLIAPASQPCSVLLVRTSGAAAGLC